MRRVWIVLVFVAAEALAQGREERAAVEIENQVVANIVDCLVAGLPEDWQQATVQINLEKPYDQTGSVSYMFTREENTRPTEPFRPCDVKKPAMLLIELRQHQPPERRGWIGAQMTILRDGRFGLRYGFPKPNP